MTSTQWLLSALMALAYFIGSIPFGLIVGLARGVDPRKAGSGNIGATNVGRLLGGRYFAIVFTLDVLKSLLPMLAASAIVHHAGKPGDFAWTTYVLWLAVGFAAILGHMFPVYLHFKGGKGVASSAGVILGLYPYYTLPAVASILTWVVVFLIWRYVSLASMMGATVFPLAYAAIGLARHWPIASSQLPLLIFAVVVAALIVLRHRSNISRLLAGTEHAFRRREKPQMNTDAHG